VSAVLPAAANTGVPDHGLIKGLQLTPAQIQALKEAYLTRHSLSVNDAEAIIAGASAVSSVIATPAYAGTAYAQENCGFIQLWGYPSGSYDFELWNNRIGPDAFGEAAFSTNGFTASISDAWFGSGYDINLQGNIVWLGWGPSGTTVSVWDVMQNGWYCSGALFAAWGH